MTALTLAVPVSRHGVMASRDMKYGQFVTAAMLVRSIPLQCKPEGAALPLLAVHADTAAVQIHNRF